MHTATDIDSMRRFVSRLHGGMPWGAWTFYLYKQGPGPKMTQEFGRCRAYPPASVPPVNAYVSVAVFRKPKRIAANAMGVGAVWADLDPPKGSSHDLDAWRADAYARLHAYVPHPTLIVDSGRGWHAYWLLRTPLLFFSANDGNYVVGINKLLQQDLHGDAVHDLARVMRLPGTLNGKTGRVAQLVFKHGPVYDFWSELHPHFASRMPAAQVRPLSASTGGTSVAAVTSPAAPRRRGRPSRGVTSKHLRALPPWARQLVVDGAWAFPRYSTTHGRVDRSRADWTAITAMVRAGWPDERIAAAFRHPDWLIGHRYQELVRTCSPARADAYLVRTIGKVRTWLAPSAEAVVPDVHDPQGDDTEVEESM